MIPTLRPAGRAILLVLAALACAPAQAAASDILFGLTERRELVSLRSDLPGVPESRRDVTGLPAEAVVLGMDSRPATGELVAAVREGATMVLYRVDPGTGVATRMSASGAQIGSATATASIAFAPDADLLRVVTATKHFLMHPVTGAVTAQDPLGYAAGDQGAKTAPKPAALTHLPRGGGGSTGLVLDSARPTGTLAAFGGDALLGDGVLTTLKALPFPIDAKGAGATSQADGAVYFAVNDAGQDQSNLYASPLESLTPGYIGPFPVKDPVVGLAVGAGGLFDFDRPAYRVREADGSVTVPIIRSGTMSAAVDVGFEVADESAITGVDLPATAGVLGFAAGQNRASVDIPVAADTEPEGEEVARVRLSSTSGPSGLGYRRQARISIVDGGVAATSPAAGAAAPAVRPSRTPAPQPASGERLSVVVTAPSLRRLSRTLGLPFACSASCKLSVEARLDRASARRIRRPAFLGRSTVRLARGGNGRARITLPSWHRWAKRYRSVRRGGVTLKVKAYGSDGRRVASLSVRAPIRR